MDLQSAAERIDEARNLTQSNDFSAGKVGHVALAEKRQEMMLAKAVHVDVFDYYHLVVTFFVERTVD